MDIRVKRIYDRPSRSDGLRILVDRYWPHGLSREKAEIGLWLKDIAPSDGLREYFSHDEEKWDEFRKRYNRELESRHAQLMELLSEAQKGTITLLFGARDHDHNNAVALKQYLDEKKEELLRKAA